MRILMTGASGLLGSEFLHQFGNDYDISVLTRDHNYINKGNEQKIYCDLSLPWDMEVLPKNIDVVVILAQEREYRAFPTNSNNIFMVNVYSVQRLLEYAQKMKAVKVIYASTGGIYKEQMEALKENSALRNTLDLSFYFSTKLAGEGLVSAYKNEFNITIMRPFFIYGKKQNQNNLLANLYKKIVSNEFVVLNGSEGIRINPINVRDAAVGLNELIRGNHNSVINLAGTEIITIRELSAYIGDLVGKVPNFIHEESKNDLIADSSKLQDILHGHKWTLLREGVEQCFSKK